MAASTALKASKNALRLSMKQRLSSISESSVISQSQNVFDSLVAWKPYQGAKRIGIYLAMPRGELQTEAIVRHALGAGKQVFVPYIHRSTSESPDTPVSIMDMVDLQSLADYDSLKRDSWGIPSISRDTIDEREHILGDATKQGSRLDMILVPGVAFDQVPETGSIRRLGHGKGFYDFFLYQYLNRGGSLGKENALNPGIGALLYGLALEEQFLPSESGQTVPVGEQDYLLHGLVMGDGQIIEYSAGRK